MKKDENKDIEEGFNNQMVAREQGILTPYHVELFGIVIDTNEIKTSKRVSTYQARFCLEYVRLRSVTKACKVCGIDNKGGYGYKLLAKPHIQEYIKGLNDLATGKIEYEAEHIVKDLLNIKELAVHKGKLDTAIRCIELLGKTKNMWKDGEGNVNIDKAVIVLPQQTKMDLTKFLDANQQKQLAEKSNSNNNV